MREKFIKFGSYLILIVGILFFLAILGVSIYVLVAYPDTAMLKKSLISSGVLIIGIIELIATISIFETMTDIVDLERGKTKRIEGNENV